MDNEASLPEEQAVKEKNVLGEVFDIIEAVVLSVVVSILILTLIFRTGFVHGSSMQSTMFENDRYIVSSLFYTPEQGDIIVFEPEQDYYSEKLFVKRVIATGGQTVKIKLDEYGVYKVYVDDVKLQEDYLDDFQVTNPPSGFDEYTVTVPEGCVYVLGDNRVVSTDSRVIGCVDARRIVGKVLFRFFPFNKIGTVS